MDLKKQKVKIALLMFILISAEKPSAIFAQDIACTNNTSQKTQTKFSGYDGIIIVGYVDQGALLNFTGPNANICIKNHKVFFGMLPSLRFKQDNTEIKNSFITPNLGIGLTYCYKKLAIQVPLYYNPKTTIKNGRWCIGAGAGIKLK